MSENSRLFAVLQCGLPIDASAREPLLYHRVNATRPSHARKTPLIASPEGASSSGSFLPLPAALVACEQLVKVVAVPPRVLVPLCLTGLNRLCTHSVRQARALRVKLANHETLEPWGSHKGLDVVLQPQERTKANKCRGVGERPLWTPPSHSFHGSLARSASNIFVVVRPSGLVVLVSVVGRRPRQAGGRH